MNKHLGHTRTRPLLLLAVAILATLAILLPARVWGDTGSAALLAQVYAHLAGLDGYAFSATVQQTTHPLPTLANVGLSSETASLLVQGSIDKPADLTQFTVSEQSGHLLDGMGQMELKLQAGEVWGRASGQAWEKLDASAAPDQSSSDPAAFLQAAANVRMLGAEERLGEVYEIYAFELDGAAWAEIMHQELQAEMTRRGELAPGEALDRLDYYERMTGVGELWLNSAGLPRRLKFHALYPPLPGESEYREVETVTDYRDFRDGTRMTQIGRIGADIGSLFGIVAPPNPVNPPSILDFASPLVSAVLLLLFLLFPVAILRYRRSPRLYRAMISLFTLILVSQPLLNASVIQAAGLRREARVATVEINRDEDRRIQAAVDQVKADFASTFDVTQGLMAQPLPDQQILFPAVAETDAAYTDAVDTDGDGLSDAQERQLRTSAAAKDSDGDGVDDATELLLGLDPTNPDTDGDLISDGFEVAGIEIGGKRWYLDPLSTDTNGDNVLDSLECIQAVDVVVSPSGKGVKGDPKGTGICADTDGDGIPDFADDDNDNDGVKDWMDGQPDSRFGDPVNGVGDKSFVYAVDDYSSGKPLRLTFELRPTNPQHLWYSMNVLDWPSGDYEGQIRRVHDTKLGTTGAAANGDMQLVPMIEVIFSGDEAIHLPTIPGKVPIVGDNARLSEWLDMDVLQRYQMAVSWTADKQSIQVYLPATLVRDSKGNAPVNFVAKMLYWPNGTGLFSKNHAARLVWLVQMDADNCVVPTDSSYAESCLPEGKNYQNGIHWQTTRQQIVHRYYDSFYITAFTAEEDLRNSAQIFYEDPVQIASPAAYVPDQLLGLGTVMESFLRQKKSPAQALQEFKAGKPTIGSRLVGAQLVEDPDAYGLMSKVTTEEAPRLLDTVFAPHRATLPYPTLLYVTWGESKVTGLKGVADGSAGALRLRMSEGSQKSATNIRLGTFTYNASPVSVGGRPNPNWDSADPGKIWVNHLQGQSAAAWQQLPPAARQKFNAEQFQQTTLGVFWNLARGISLANDLAKPLADNLENVRGLVNEINAAFDNGGNNTIGALIGVFDDFKDAQENLGQAAQNQAGAKKALLSLVGKDVKNAANLKGALKTAKFAKGLGLASVTFAGVSATLSVVIALKDQLGLSDATVTALDAINATVSAVMASIQISLEITKVIQSVQAFSGTAMAGLKNALAFQSTMSSVGAMAAVIVAALILVTAFVMYFKLLSDGDAVAARTALAQGVATAIVVLLLFVISTLFPIGTAIALLIGLLDGILNAICKIANWVGEEDEQGQNFEARNWWCKGVVGNTVLAIAGLFYKSLPMVDMAYANRLQFGQTDTRLIPVADLVGMNAGNRLQVTQPVTMTVRLPDAHSLNRVSTGGIPTAKPGFIGVDNSGPMTLADYERLIKEKNLFNYELITDLDADKNSQLAERTTPASWKSIGQPDNRDRFYKTDAPTIQITLTAGINWNPDLFVREYYKYALAECGLFAGGCDYKLEHFNKFKADTQVITIGTNLIYDVFPQTLTDFYTLEQVQENGQFVNKYRLAWGGKKPFPTLLDADGDGLRADLDPDDKTGDADNDGLPDAFEMQDSRLNPLSADSDGDGLADYEEIRRGTRPDRADTDGDGLSDNDEITGWELVYADADGATRRTWVTSDPLVFDTDGDGFSDQQERVLGAHPRARNTDLSVLTIRTRTNQTDSTFLAPSQTIAFTSTVTNDLRKPVAYGLLEAEILNSAQVINPITFELQPRQGRDLTGNIAAPAQPVNNSEEITLRNRAGANLVDPSASYADQLRGLAQPNGLKFQINFEQRPADERNFRDVTGNATLTCSGDYCPSVVRGTDSYGAFRANSWYTAQGGSLAFTQPRFSLGGWVTLESAFGGKYSERVIFGPDNANGAVGGSGEKYLQLSVVDLQSATPKARIHFTATDGAVCEQVLTGLTVPVGQKTHLFVTYDGTLVHAYKNGQPVGSYNLQNCGNKVPAGNRFTIGRGSSDATLYVHNVYYRALDEGDGYFSGAEAYLQLNSSAEPFARWEGVKNGQTRDIGRELSLRTNASGDANSTVYLCEEDRGDKQGQCRSDSGTDSDDFLGTVTVDPRRNGSFNTGWSSGEGSGSLHFNVQNNFFQGSLDDLRIYESTLTPQEVGQLINGSGLTYQLDEASGRTQFRNAGVDVTQLFCGGGAGCPTSGLKGYSGQAVRFDGNGNQTLMIERLRERFGSNLVTSFWFKPEAGSGATVPLLRYGQNTDGFTLFATQQAGATLLRPRFNYAATTLIGRPGGSAYNLSCNPGEALVGIIGGAGNVIDRVGPLCVTTTPDYASWTADPVQRGSAGGSGGGGYIRTCPRDSYVTGFSGRAGGLVDRIQLECARTVSAGVLDSRNPTRLDGAGGNGGSLQPQQVCPSGLPANGIYGMAGGLVDQFGLTCTTQLPAAGASLPAGQWSHVAVAQNGDTLLLYVNGQPAQNIWFGASPRAEYRLTGNYWPDLALGNGVRGTVDEVQVQGLTAPVDESVRKPYAGSALVHLALDETPGSATFVNSTGGGNLLCADAANCPQAGLKGQVRESLQFNNQPGMATSAAPRLTVPERRDNPFSFSAWVRLITPPTGPASLVALHANESAEAPAWRLQLINSSGQTVPQLVGSFASGNSCSGNFTVTPTNVNLALNQWQHLGVNYDPSNGKNDVSLYLNGRLIHQERMSGLLCRTGTTLRFGQGYRGQMDEFFYYSKSLEVSEFLSQFVYQSTWFDTISTERFRVDYNPPTARLTAAAFVKPGTNIFGVAVSDGESGIRSVEYKDADGVWKPARAETTTSGVWVFGRDVQGSTLIEVRATDNVGNTRTDSKTVNIDSTPPTVALTTAGKQKSLTIQGTASDAGSGLQSATLMIIDPFGQPFASPRDVAVVNGAWQYSQELPPTVNGAFQVWMSAVDQMGNQFRGVIGSVQMDNAPPVPTLNPLPAALTGLDVPIAPTLPVVQGSVTDQPTGNVAPNAQPSPVQRVEVGLLHRQDKDDPSKVVWQEATLGSTGQTTTTWQFQMPAGLEGIYDLSLRTADALGNERVLPGLWTGVIDTRAPQIVLAGGAVAGQQSCTVTDFSLGQTSFTCANVSGTGSATSALYASGVFTGAGLNWNAQWYRDLFQGRVPAERLYALRQTGVSFGLADNNVVTSCDIYGNCNSCFVSGGDVGSSSCFLFTAGGLARSAADEEPTEDQNLFDTALTGPGIFTVTVAYERPDAYVPGEQPATPTSEWVTISEPFTLVDDAVLAATRPFAGDFTEATVEIAWGESVSATEYYAGWTLTETVNLDDLTVYAGPDVHVQTLADRGRYYAHVVAVDAAGESNAFTLGPVYFDGATPASYLNWDEFGPGQPYWFWEEALSATGQVCNLLGEEDRANIFSGGASARSRLQSLYGTWDDEWLALHWYGLHLETDGDLHLYLDTAPGGAIHAFDPYAPIAQAQSLVVMPERRQYKSDAVDRMLADFAVIVEDSQSVRLLSWNGSAWQDASTGQMRFSVIEGDVYLWLPLTLLGVNPSAMDISLVGFISEEESMEIWATMPGNNPLNSPAMLPAHLPAATSVDRTLVNLQTSMRLSSDPSVNNTLDNCPTNILFDESLLDVQFIADPAAEIYDPVVYEGIRAVVPDDVEALLAVLCTGVTDVSQSGVCQLAQEVAQNVGGDGPEVGPTGLLPATAGPGDTLTFYASVRNLSSQESGHLALEVEGDLPSNGSVLDVGTLAPFETKVVSFTEVVDPGANYDFAAMTVYPVEEVENTEEGVVITYVHEPHTVIHDIDRTPPSDGGLDENIFWNNVMGTGEQLLEGLVFDQSPLAQITLQTSLGETVVCDDTMQINAFASVWACAISVPAETPDGTQVQVSLSAEDIYGFASGVIGQWTLEVDNTAPEVTLFDEAGRAARGIQATANTTETLLLEGLAGDERWLGGVQVCDGLDGFESCAEAEMFFFSDLISDTARSAALSTQLADEAYWSLERTVDRGIEGATVPVTVTGYDAAGNVAQLRFDLLVDTLAPTVTLAAQPVTAIAFDGAFSLNGSVSDRAGVSFMELEVLDPLGEYSYYPIALDNPGAVNTGWRYERSPDTDEFAIPGDYTYLILAYDDLGNEREVGRGDTGGRADTEFSPYGLTVGAPDQPLLNAPFFVATSNDLWEGFAPGGSLYTRVEFDDADLSLGDAITVTADPLPAWLTINRLDERSVEISGTVPLTITQITPPDDAPVQETEEITPLLQINLGLTITDSTGRQDYRNWTYEQLLRSGEIYLPFIFNQGAVVSEHFLYLPALSR
ncbi:MAG: hypothetical protein KF893_16145 [Caldilineaceae bacterium]|nr:hypothetical protein [Caldilineaceae bacterium]